MSTPTRSREVESDRVGSLVDGLRRLPRGRTLIALVVLALVVAGMTALALTRESSGLPLDPDNPKPPGAQAMARVLDDQGVDVVKVRGTDAISGTSVGPGDTLVVTNADLPGETEWKKAAPTLQRAGRLVLVAPDARALAALDVDASVTAYGGSATEAGCSLPEARGLSVDGDGSRYSSDVDGATTCFRPGGGFSAGGDDAGALLHLPRTSDRPETFLVGSEDVVRNAGVLDSGHAALGLRLLGHSPRLVWLNATRSDADLGTAPPARWPAWFGPVVLMLVLSTLVLVLWRGRRLGRVVHEKLPVVVPASETTRTRGQLYRRAGDTHRSSIVLRAGTRRRARSYLGLSRGTAARTLVDEIARSTGRAPHEVDHLLHGPPVTTEAELVRLATELTTLEKEIRHR